MQRKKLSSVRFCRSGQLADGPQPVTTRRSHSAGLPVSVRNQRMPPPLPVSITGQRSLQPHHVHPERPPPPPHPSVTASAYQRSIYRGDPGRMAQAPAGQAQQPQPGTASASQAADVQLPGQSSEAEQAPTEAGPRQPDAAALPEMPESSQGASQGSDGMPAASTDATAPAPTAVPEDSSKRSSGQPEGAAGNSMAEANQQGVQQSQSGTPAAHAAQPQPLHMPPLPPPAVHHVNMGRAELDDILKATPRPVASHRKHLNLIFASRIAPGPSGTSCTT